MTTMEYVFGIDVSKRKLDTALIHRGKLKSKVFENTPAGHRVMLRWLEDRGAVQSNTHICLEATGPYSEPVALAASGVPLERDADHDDKRHVGNCLLPAGGVRWLPA